MVSKCTKYPRGLDIQQLRLERVAYGSAMRRSVSLMMRLGRAILVAGLKEVDGGLYYGGGRIKRDKRWENDLRPTEAIQSRGWPAEVYET